MEQEKLFFSIIIPTYNRAEALKACLTSLSHLDYPRDRFEVIIVDDGSKKPLGPVIDSFSDPLDIILVRQENAGPAAARNTGAGQARGDILAFTDDDCAPAYDWLKTLAAYFGKTRDNAVGGKTINVLSGNLYAVGSQMLIDYLYAYYNADSDRASFLTSNNLALPTEHFRSMGGFKTIFPRAAGEDREFCAHWLHRGYGMVYAPEIRVRHAHNMTFTGFWRQHFNYGRGAFRFHQMRSLYSQKHKKREPLSFYANLMLYPFSQPWSRITPFIGMLFFITQLANSAGYFWEQRKTGHET